jgi:uncharacterized protein YoaH (UPF0181 family)
MKFNLMKACSRGMMILLMGVGLLTAVAAQADPNALISTQQLLQDLQTAQQRESVSSFLTRDDVQSQLMARGVDAGDALQRVAAMSSAELASIAAKIDELPAGAGLLETALFLLVIFMLLDIAGVTDIFPGL